MAGRPLNGRSRGKHVLAAMKALSPNLHESLVEIWDTVIPKLTQFLDGNVLSIFVSRGHFQDGRCIGKFMSQAIMNYI